MQITLRSSQIAAADNCRRLMKHQYLDGIKPLSQSANLAFGRVIDAVVQSYLNNLTLGLALFDPATHFKEKWQEVTATSLLTYSATQSPKQFERMGVDLLSPFPDAWDTIGLQVALTLTGVPMLSLYLRCFLGRHAGIEVFLEGTLDIGIYTPRGALAIIDLKSAAAAHTPLYTRRSDQLTCYQILVTENRHSLGLPPLGGLGFLDFLKRQASSRIEPPLIVGVRSDAEIAEFKRKCFWLAEDIVRGRFPKASRMQFNTPCDGCYLAEHCVNGDPEGLVFPSPGTNRPAHPA